MSRAAAPQPRQDENPRLFETHCHVVEGVFGDADQVDATLERGRQAGVGRFLVIGSGYGADSVAPALQVARRHADVWATAGLHPHDARHWGPAVEAALRAAAADPRVVAVGEAGLDFYYDQSPRPAQREALAAQAALARQVGKPLVVHDRDSAGEVLDILRAEGAFDGAGVLWHCFTGDVEMMRAVVDAGACLSLSGIVTFGSADALRQVAAQAPLDRLLIETDSPWLAPVPHRGKRNEPAFLPHVLQQVARCRGVEPAQVARATWDNACRLFGLPA
ncbi:TatD family hydrolase [Myxococcota bacterium]|nr:TatD family hydrolase [Myxococcota bacterium]